jgi:hypothetical protein
VKPLEGQMDLFSRPRTGREVYDEAQAAPDAAPDDDAEDDAETRAKQRAAILARLQQGPATNADLNKIGHRYSARIFELREAGHTIETKCIKARVYRYTLT